MNKRRDLQPAHIKVSHLSEKSKQLTVKRISQCIVGVKKATKMLLSLSQCLYNNFTLMLLFALQLITQTHARIISACDRIELETTEYIPNLNTACNSRYPYIYCDGEESAYCTQDECLEDYRCERDDISDLQGKDQVPATTSATSVITAGSTAVTRTTTTSTTAQTIASSTTTTEVTPTTTTSTAAALNIPTTIKPLLTTIIYVENIKNLCRAGVYAHYPYPSNCRYYYRCTNGYFLLQECGYLMFFDAYDGYCKSAKEARCISPLRSTQF